MRPYKGSFLKGLKSFTIGPAGNTAYVLSGSKIYDFPVVP